ITQLIPVRPAQHYTMAGVRTDKDGAAYGLKGLFSAGEAACWDMHGFNRLGGNSLAETIVAGKIVGEKIAEFLQGYDVQFNTAVIRDAASRDQERIDRLIAGKDGNENVYDIRTAMQDELMERVGIFRNGTDLQKAVDNLQEIHARSQKVGLRSNGVGVNPELTLALKIEGMVRLALCTAYGALQRTESRGCHSRDDYEARNDRDWLNRTLATWREGGDLPTLDYEPASKTMEIPPGERGYGVCKIISCDGEIIGE
ncbi:FAD-binding protein, partial [Thermodesulfobacteriota bacterium]